MGEKKVKLSRSGKPRLNALGFPFENAPAIQRKRKEPYKNPIQAATKHGISVGLARGHQMVVDAIFENASLLSVVIGYRIFEKMVKNSELNKHEMRVLVLAASFNSLQRGLMPAYGFGTVTANRVMNSLMERGYVQMIMKKPISYSLTIKGKEFIQPYNAEFNKLLRKTSRYVKKQNGFTINLNSKEEKQRKISRRQEINEMFTKKQPVRIEKYEKRKL